jgi:hypothetical protein
MVLSRSGSAGSISLSRILLVQGTRIPRIFPVYKKGREGGCRDRAGPRSGLGPSIWNEGAKMPPIKKAENQLRRQSEIQGVVRTQVFGMKGKNWVRLAKNTQSKRILSCIFYIHKLKSEISCRCLARRPRAQQRTSEWRRRWLPVPTRICMSGAVTGSAPSSTCSNCLETLRKGHS